VELIEGKKDGSPTCIVPGKSGSGNFSVRNRTSGGIQNYRGTISSRIR
jgi:hypothetical protein